MPMIGFSRLVAGFKLLDEGNDPLLAQAEPCWIIHSMKCKCCFRPVEIPGLSQQRRPQDDHVEVALALAPPHDDQRPDSHLTPPFNPTPFVQGGPSRPAGRPRTESTRPSPDRPSGCSRSPRRYRPPRPADCRSRV